MKKRKKTYSNKTIVFIVLPFLVVLVHFSIVGVALSQNKEADKSTASSQSKEGDNKGKNTKGKGTTDTGKKPATRNQPNEQQEINDFQNKMLADIEKAIKALEQKELARIDQMNTGEIDVAKLKDKSKENIKRYIQGELNVAKPAFSNKMKGKINEVGLDRAKTFIEGDNGLKNDQITQLKTSVADFTSKQVDELNKEKEKLVASSDDSRKISYLMSQVEALNKIIRPEQSNVTEIRINKLEKSIDDIKRYLGLPPYQTRSQIMPVFQALFWAALLISILVFFYYSRNKVGILTSGIAEVHKKVIEVERRFIEQTKKPTQVTAQEYAVAPKSAFNNQNQEDLSRLKSDLKELENKYENILREINNLKENKSIVTASDKKTTPFPIQEPQSPKTVNDYKSEIKLVALAKLDDAREGALVEDSNGLFCIGYNLSTQELVAIPNRKKLQSAPQFDPLERFYSCTSQAKTGNIMIVKPAIVSTTPGVQEWWLEEKGVLEFI